jgi:putative solute:sodium symporter small subunit
MDNDSPRTEGPDLRDEAVRGLLDRYWISNLKITLFLLFLWAVAGLGCGILFADHLNAWILPGTGYPLGFWFAQQGSIVIFVLLILAYCVYMNRLDAGHHSELEELGEKKRD